MAITIKLPGNHPGSELHAGISFTDGISKVGDLSPNAEVFLTRLGATVKRSKPAAPAPERDPADGDA